MTEQVKQNTDKLKQTHEDVRNRLLKQYREKGKEPIRVEPPRISTKLRLYRSNRKK